LRLVNHFDQDFAIAFIDDARTFGGAQIALGWAIRAILRKTSWRIVCVCPTALRQAVEGIIGGNTRVEFTVCPSSLPVNIFTFPLRIATFLKLLRLLRRTGVHAWWMNLSGVEFCLAPLVVLKLLGEKPCAWLHNPQRFSLLDRWGSLNRRVFARIRDKIAEWFLFRLYSRIATPSLASAELLRGRIGSAYAPAISYLYPTVSLDSGCGSASTVPEAECPAEIRMWMIGRVEYCTKNNELALHLLKNILADGGTASLTIVGDGPDMKSVKSSIRDFGIVDRVKLTGWISDPWASITNDSIVLIPSFYECMPLTAIEAMLRGIPLVASPIPAFFEGVPRQMIADDFTPLAFAQRLRDVREMDREKMADLYGECLARFSESSFVTALARNFKQ
jgi:glycosyltransferase involved in cell wall biosynthesis